MRYAIYLMLVVVPLLAGSCMMPNRQAQVEHNEKLLLAEGITSLKTGDPMPAAAFILPTTAGAPFVLGPTPPTSPILLYFYSMDDAPNCAQNLIALEKELPKLKEHGIQVYAVNPASVERHTAFATANRLTLPLASDPGGKASQAYGCLLPDGEYPQRTSILIDTAGKIALFYRGLAPVTLILESLGIPTK